METNTGILLVNTGTPDSVQFQDVKRYLKEFLLDARILDKPLWIRELLVHGVIVPFRYKKSARAYAKIWTANGSPLLVHTQVLAERLQEALGLPVEVGMRYGNPSIESGLKKLQFCQKIVIVPLFPQYASATSGSVLTEAMRVLSSWQVIPEVVFKGPFSTDEDYMQAWVANAQGIDFSEYDHVLFSFHGLPLSQIRKADRTGCCLKKNCCNEPRAENAFCYSAQCKTFGHELAMRLGITNYSITFQSRLGIEKWLSPYTAQVIQDLRKQGAKKLLVFSPSFVADCLETLYEISIELRDEFLVHGGERLDLVPSLNDNPLWIEALCNTLKNNTLTAI